MNTTKAIDAPETYREFDLLEFQKKAIGAVIRGEDVVVAAPTGSGKTLVAEWAIQQSLNRNRRAFFTTPVKALSNQKYRDFCRIFGAANVGILTGDVKINPTAKVMVMTTEVYRGWVTKRHASLPYFDLLVLDELHYLDDPRRGSVWEESIIFTPPNFQLVALSASIPDANAIAKWLHAVRHREVDVTILPDRERPVKLSHRFWVASQESPGRYTAVPLQELPPDHAARPGAPHPFLRFGKDARAADGILGYYAGGLRPWAPDACRQLIEYLVEEKALPAIYFCTRKSDCQTLAQMIARHQTLLMPSEAETASAEFDRLMAGIPSDPTGSCLRQLAVRGIGFHHAGLRPHFKVLVERLFELSLIRLLFATGTFAVGVNMPAKTVCLHILSRAESSTDRALSGREYNQMAGRAGRLSRTSSSANDAGRVISLLGVNEIDMDRLRRYVSGEVEPICSRFQPGYEAILNFMDRGRSIEEVWRQSYCHFDDVLTAPQRTERLEQMLARARFLKEIGYIDGGTPTSLGRICAAIAGNDLGIQVTEAYREGLLARWNPVQIAVLFAALAFERGGWLSKHLGLPADALAFVHHLSRLSELERSFGIAHPLRLPQFHIAGKVKQWVQGGSLSTILGNERHIDAGAFIMNLRLAAQGISSLAAGLPREDPCVANLLEAQARLQRGEVEPTRDIEYHWSNLKDTAAPEAITLSLPLSVSRV